MSGVPRVLDVRGVPPGEADLRPVAAHVGSGGLVAYPTETVYGFGGACTVESVGRLAALKRREAHKPLLVLIAGPEMVPELAWTEEARELGRIFWPGAVTLVLGDPTGIFPEGIRSPSGSVAVRVSPHPLVSVLLDELGGPLTSTSANVPGAPPARSGAEATRAAVELGAGTEMLVLEAGTLPASGPSTIVECTGARTVVVREGTVPLHRLRCVLPDVHGR